jgi:isopropylmalate/homocitrate/citramalate synthase
VIALPEAVRIREVGPRDGFQNEPDVVATDDKVALVEALAAAGLRRLEVTSFVRADVIPQLADVDLVEAVGVHERVLEAANVLAALDSGVESFESSFGELGGCPVPAGATGNVATEDLVSMLHEMGVVTGISVEALLDATRRLSDVLGRPLGSHLLAAGPVEWSAGT